MIFDLKRIDEKRNGKSDRVQSIFQDLEEKNILMERRLKSCLPKLTFLTKKKYTTLSHLKLTICPAVSRTSYARYELAPMHEMLHFDFLAVQDSSIGDLVTHSLTN